MPMTHCVLCTCLKKCYSYVFCSDWASKMLFLEFIQFKLIIWIKLVKHVQLLKDFETHTDYLFVIAVAWRHVWIHSLSSYIAFVSGHCNRSLWKASCFEMMYFVIFLMSSSFFSLIGTFFPEYALAGVRRGWRQAGHKLLFSRYTMQFQCDGCVCFDRHSDLKSGTTEER
jgi:hypothetical protein